MVYDGLLEAINQLKATKRINNAEVISNLGITIIQFSIIKLCKGIIEPKVTINISPSNICNNHTSMKTNLNYKVRNRLLDVTIHKIMGKKLIEGKTKFHLSDFKKRIEKWG